MALGKRICVLGPSNSGKSTFAERLGRKLNYPVLHLDQIAFLPHTNWVLAPIEETKRRHDAFIENETWIVDGQYMRYMPNRLARADTIVMIETNRFKCLLRYLLRCIFGGKQRPGRLEGATREFNFEMVTMILFLQPKTWKTQMELIKHYPHIHIIKVRSFKELDELLA